MGLVAAAITLAIACDLDPLGMSERPLAGNYYLKLGDDEKSYYLFEGSDPIGTRVLRVGWNTRYILVDRRGFTPDELNGVVIIDVRTQQVSGPFTEVELATNPNVAGIKMMPADAAWESIPWKPPWSGA